jgi:heme-degrading monooxygenase HmoA
MNNRNGKSIGFGINDKGYRKDNQNMDNRRNWQQDEEKQNKHSTQHVLDTNKPNNGNKTLALLQTTGGKDKRNIASTWKSQQTPQRGTQNAMTRNRTTQKPK